MPKRDPDLLVQDMLDATRKIEMYTAGLDHAAFLRDEKTADAVVRNLEVLGEAARQMPDDFTSANVWLLLIMYLHSIANNSSSRAESSLASRSLTFLLTMSSMLRSGFRTNCGFNTAKSKLPLVPFRSRSAYGW